MALVPAICTQCGANISADKGKDCMICPYCNTPFIVEKAINKFNVTYNISGSVVNIYNSNSNDFDIRAGKLIKYNGVDINVIIPSNVVEIGNLAFDDCSSMVSVTIPTSVKIIGDVSFRGCRGLTSVTIPSSVTSIGSSAFFGCRGLTSVTIPSSVAYIGDGAFSGCSGLTSVTIPSSVTSIGYHAFSGCRGLTSVTIPSSVTYIGDGAFSECSRLVNVIVPPSAKQNGRNVFSKTPWQDNMIKLKRCTYCGGQISWLNNLCKTCQRERTY
ncbi:MAG: leucine-rich repeat protein [Lachnospiraceae bacterium]|nr:leucine-rich repeat protein [Lachnospiraceae bacterium]